MLILIIDLFNAMTINNSIKYNFLRGFSLESFYKMVNIIRINCLSYYIQLVRELIARTYESYIDPTNIINENYKK